MHTRRDFLKGTAVAGASLAAASCLIVIDVPPFSDLNRAAIIHLFHSYPVRRTRQELTLPSLPRSADGTYKLIGVGNPSQQSLRCE